MLVRACGLFAIFVLALFTSSTSSYPSGGRQNEASGDPAPAIIACSANATRCWAEGKLLHADGQCYAALTRGPCPAGQWWLLDRNGSNASARGKCAALSCPPDARPHACRRRMERIAQACPRLPNGDAQFAVHTDPSGRFRCGEFPGRVQALHAQVRCRSPAVGIPGAMRPSFTVNTNGWLCAPNDQGDCQNGVEGSQPQIALTSED